MYGPELTFLGVPRGDLDDPASLAGADVAIVGAPFDGGTSHRPGARFGPGAIRGTDYLGHDGSRPHLALGVDPLKDLRVVDVGDVLMLPGEIEPALQRLEQAVHRVAAAGAIPVVLGGDHTIALPDVTGVARQHGFGRVSVIHFDAHADTGDRFLQLGLRGYWPPPEVLAWMAEQGMRTFEMAEIGRRGLDACLSEAFATATDDCDGVFLSVDIDVVDPGMAPGTGTPEPGGLTARELLDAVRRCALELPVVGVDVVELPPRLARDLDGAFEELVRGHERLLYGLALRVVGNAHDAEEVAQDAFERAYHALAGYPAERVAALRLRPWLARIALNLARTRLRRRTPPTRPLETADGEPLPLAAPAGGEPAAVAERRQDRELWAELLAGLPARYREAVVLRHVEDLPYAEVAEVLGQPVGTVKTHVHRGVRLLRVAFEARKETLAR